MRADYKWSHDASTGGVGDRNAEQWLRATWEGSPRVLRVVLGIAWKYGLGLRLGSTADATRILGWRITNTQPNQVTVDADSRILKARNTVSLADESIHWQTTVTYTNVAGRLIWTAARIVHQFLVPRLVRRAIRHAPSSR